MPIAPRPSAETAGPVRPRVRVFIVSSFVVDLKRCPARPGLRSGRERPERLGPGSGAVVRAGAGGLCAGPGSIGVEVLVDLLAGGSPSRHAAAGGRAPG